MKVMISKYAKPSTICLLIISTVLLIGSYEGTDAIVPSSNHASRQELSVDSIWELMRTRQGILKDNMIKQSQELDFYVKKFSKESNHLIGLSKRASPYIHYILEELKKRQMPSELAIIPMVESTFLEHALSNHGAMGIWQISRHTGTRFGLKQDYWYDGRKDFHESTRAALDYLSFLYKTFDEDWLLAIAAYNAGEGRLKKAIKQNALKNQKTDFWSLNLPKQTRHHVPKLLALAYIIKHHEKFSIHLPKINNQPYLKLVQINVQIDLNIAADLANMPIKKLKRYNPGYQRHITHPNGPHHLLLPVAHVEHFQKSFASIKQHHFTYNNIYMVQNGDSLSKISRQHKISIQEIMKINHLTSHQIIVGQQIIIPNCQKYLAGQIVQVKR